MEGKRAPWTAGLARTVLERAMGRRPERQRTASVPVPEEDSERLNAAFTSIVNLMNQATKECEKYYSSMAACKCEEHEIKHMCRYHGRQAKSKEETRKASKDIYIEVSPGTYCVTATSEGMVKQTHVVDVSAGQSIDLTFVF